MYDELVARLWECASGECFNCSQYTETTNASVCSKELMKQAADAIENLICEVADEHNARLDAEERQRWIPVTEALPERGESVLVYRSGDNRVQPKERIDVCPYLGDGIFCLLGVAYWMPLPQPPEEE